MNKQAYGLLIMAAIIIAILATPLRAQSPESTWEYIYDNTIVIPDDVCYGKDYVPMIQASYGYHLSITYTNLDGNIIILEYSANISSRWIVNKVTIKARPEKRPVCYN